MSRRGRVRVGLLAVLAVLQLGAVTVPEPPTVAVLGDSYASGEGLPTATGLCGRSDDAWSTRVAVGLGASTTTVLACSGAEVADVTVGGDLGEPPQLEQLAASGPVDLVLLTVGGNDLGFVEIVADCLGLVDPGVAARGDTGAALGGDGTGWRALLEGGGDRGCAVSREELLGRVDALGEADRFPLAGGATGSLADLYVQVAQDHLTDGGTLVVVGYPALFAEADAWPERYGDRCHGLRASDAMVLDDVTAALAATIEEQVAVAAEVLGAGRVVHVPVRDAFAETGDDHRLCGGGAPWVNGLTIAEGGVDVTALLNELGANGFDPATLDLEAIGARPGASFHPNTAGHAGTAEVVLDAFLGG